MPDLEMEIYTETRKKQGISEHPLMNVAKVDWNGFWEENWTSN